MAKIAAADPGRSGVSCPVLRSVSGRVDSDNLLQLFRTLGHNANSDLWKRRPLQGTHRGLGTIKRGGRQEARELCFTEIMKWVSL